MALSLTIRIVLLENDPNGLRTMELSNTTAFATIVPRLSLELFLKTMPEARRPGAYVLIGPDPDNGDETRVYIGEGDPVGPRLRQHVVKKDFWKQAIVFTSKDGYISKTQIQYLEAELYATVKAAARARLDNANAPGQPAISNADRAEVEDFLAKLKLLVASVGLDFLTSREATVDAARTGDVFRFKIKTADARMLRTAPAYVVLRDSTAIVTPPDYAKSQTWVRKMREGLVESGILTREGDLYRFTKDAAFDTPSAAAASVAAGGVNGRVSWKRDGDGKTLKDVEEEEAARAIRPAAP